MSDDPQTRDDPDAPPVGPGTAPTPPEDLYPGVFAEIDRLQNRKSSWLGAVIILAVSLGLFLVVGLKGVSSFSRLLALVPILLFHESGHWLAMKVFGYRNLRMFFIPGFGAAVTGRHYNVAGWKKAVVSLMGPVPGIVVGIGIGVFGLVVHSGPAVQAGLLTVILNGFNLIPVLPLDGGHVVHTILFSRHPVLDVVFRGVAAMVIAIGGGLLQSYIFIGLGSAMLVALPTTLRVAGVASDLRREGVDASSDDSQTIPTDVAALIITALKQRSKRPVADKILAVQTIQVFENLNTRPPGWLASTALLGVHALSFLGAIAFAILFSIGQSGALRDFARAAANRPKYEFVASNDRHTPVPPLAPGAGVNTIVATYPKPADAQSAYERIAAAPEPGHSAALLGNTVFVRVPADDGAARTRTLDSLQPGSADLFVDGTAMHAAFRVNVLAPTVAAAEEIEEELNAYFGLPLWEHCLPPWASPDPVTPQQRAARSAYAALQDIGVFEDPEIVEHQKRALEAGRRGDAQAAKALGDESAALMKSVRLKKLEESASRFSDPGAAELAREYIEIVRKSEHLYPGREGITALSRHFGTIPRDSADPTAGLCALSGYVDRTALVITVEFVSFVDPAAGAAALIRWLESRGCNHTRYEIAGYEGPAVHNDEELD